MPLNIVRNDITSMAVDAIVDPTNSGLIPGGGTDAAIHQAAGPALMEACKSLGSCAPGQARIAPGFGLPARYVIFTVGPKWYDGKSKERETLASCYRSCLELARGAGCQSVAFPLIASGTFGFPKEEALNIAAAEIRRFLESCDMDVSLVVYDNIAFRLSQERFRDIQSFIDQRYVDSHKLNARRFELSSPAFGSRPYSRHEDMSAPVYHSASSQMPSEAEECADDPEELFQSAVAQEPSAPAAPSMAMPSMAEPPAPAPLEAARPKASPPQSASPFERKPAKAAPREKKREAVYTEKKAAQSLEDFMQLIDESFSQMLLRKIDERGMTDAQCYKRAHIDRKLFSKIRKDPNYRPSKPTVLSFAIALELDLSETREMLMKAGFALSHSSKFDIIVEYYILRGIYDILEINEALYSFDQVLLGS